MTKPDKPFNKIMRVRAKLDLFVRFGDNALGDQTLEQFMVEVNESFELLMAFRNIVNGMVNFDDTPERSVLPYLSESVIREAAEIDAS